MGERCWADAECAGVVGVCRGGFCTCAAGFQVLLHGPLTRLPSIPRWFEELEPPQLDGEAKASPVELPRPRPLVCVRGETGW